MDISYSFQPSTPQAHCAGETSMAATLCRVLPLLSSSLFDCKEESGWRCSRRAVEGASAISPSLPLFNSLMKFRSEERWCKHTAIQYSGCIPQTVCLSVLVYLSITLSATLLKLSFWFSLGNWRSTTMCLSSAIFIVKGRVNKQSQMWTVEVWRRESTTYCTKHINDIRAVYNSFPQRLHFHRCDQPASRCIHSYSAE